jgi:hypothetical protein
MALMPLFEYLDGPKKFNKFFDRLKPDVELDILTRILTKITEEADVAIKEAKIAVDFEQKLKQIAENAENSAKDAEKSASLEQLVKNTPEVPFITYAEADEAFKLAESEFKLAVQASISASQDRQDTQLTNTGSKKYDIVKLSVNNLFIQEAAELSANAAALYAKAASSEKATLSVALKTMSSSKAKNSSQYAAFASQYATDLKDIALAYKDVYTAIVLNLKEHIRRLEEYMIKQKEGEGEHVNIILSQEKLIDSLRLAKKTNQSIINVRNKYEKNIESIARPVEENPGFLKRTLRIFGRGGTRRKRKTRRRKNKRTNRKK